MNNSFNSLVKSKPVKQEVSHTFPYGDCSIAKSQKFKITKREKYEKQKSGQSGQRNGLRFVRHDPVVASHPGPVVPEAFRRGREEDQGRELLFRIRFRGSSCRRCRRRCHLLLFPKFKSFFRRWESLDSGKWQRKWCTNRRSRIGPVLFLNIV